MNIQTQLKPSTSNNNTVSSGSIAEILNIENVQLNFLDLQKNSTTKYNYTEVFKNK